MRIDRRGSQTREMLYAAETTTLLQSLEKSPGERHDVFFVSAKCTRKHSVIRRFAFFVDHINDRSKIHIKTENSNSLRDDRSKTCGSFSVSDQICGRHRRNDTTQPIDQSALLIE